MAMGVARFIAYIFTQLFFEIIFEVVIRGTGYLIIKPFKKDADMHDLLSAIMGILFYIGLFALILPYEL